MTSSSNQAQTGAPGEDLRIRSYADADQTAVSHLYDHGLLAGQLAGNDTGADIEFIADAYLEEPASHFWVAEVNGQIRGMIGVAKEGQTAQIRRLRVDKAWQHTSIPNRLIETALSHCQEHGYLKVVFDTRFETEQTLHIFDRCGFQHTRTRDMEDKEMLEFYLDLYRDPAPENT